MVKYGLYSENEILSQKVSAMFLTKECDYAIRVVRELADGEIKTTKTICDNEQIPVPFAYKILKKLENAGIISAHRGAAGGYRLAKKPDQISLFDIVNTVDENLFINECLKRDYICPNNTDGKNCGLHREFCRLQLLLINALSEKTISELI